MGYTAHVLRVMIASPGDVTEARDAIEKAIYSWNTANAHHKRIILQPWRWESAAVPVLGGHPQELINTQGVDESDIVFAVFGSRLGSPTPAAVSGTAEEIQRANDQGKPVHLYFSKAPLPSDVDTTQLDALRNFKRDLQDRGLLGQFNDLSDLAHQVRQAIDHDIAKVAVDVPANAPKTGVDFDVQPQHEREFSGTDKRGKAKYSTRRWFDITNTSSVDAEAVQYEVVGESSSLHLAVGDSATVIHKGQTRRLPYMLTMGGEEPVLRIKWTEDGEQQHKDFHVG
ncbi:DUF4062 domain-containing protein [Amycolatopsis sp. TNS106]|uniref:DUF4062 domain-containing protein n=1 Tax=Amycolatopsis sp. TNS106 TaxID=2861750 RepID=UPI001C55E051|nr:DUF4062 domain-containing protein [Amycolatopsis sp. TNS106]QXV63560.1 DUF4062 domain-containing protein [Amycolatopsis sp. TNS106]